MDLKNKINQLFKTNGLSFITVIIIGLLTYVYFNHILPGNERKEDANNIAALKGFEDKLKEYIEDQEDRITRKTAEGLDNWFKNNAKYDGALADYYIDKIDIVQDPKLEITADSIKLKRDFKIALYHKKDASEAKKEIKKKENVNKQTVNKEIGKKNNYHDSIYINLSKFMIRFSPNTNFTSFYICEVRVGEVEPYKTKTPLFYKNVNLLDQDSLIKNGRKNGPFSFKNSSKRYYSDQITIPNTNIKLFLTAGVNNSTFQSKVQNIESRLLIFCAVLIIILILCISFLKPIISSHKERISQIDLISVITSIGTLLSVLVVFFMLFFWDDAIEDKNDKDLKFLAESIDTYFEKNIKTYKSWQYNDTVDTLSKDSSVKKKVASYNKKIKNTPYESIRSRIFFKDTILEKNTPKSSKDKSASKDSYMTKNDSILLSRLSSLSRMDKKGIMTYSINKRIPKISRKYNTRSHFKMLQNIDTVRVLTTAYSRSSDLYQWIYAERDTTEPIIKSTGIKSIAFNENFSEFIKAAPGTEYMILDRKGNVLIHYNSDEKDYYNQNLIVGTENNQELINLLSGLESSSFKMDYKGIKYQVYAKKSNLKVDSPIYILGIRDLGHVDNRLSLFTFTNGFIISVLYALFTILTTFIYSNLFYRNRLDLSSKQHFQHLFPDNSRSSEYKLLTIIYSFSILLIIALSFFSTPTTTIYCSVIMGANLTLANSITLNIRSLNPKKEFLFLLKVLFIFGIWLPLILLYYSEMLLAALVFFSTHLALIFHYRKERNRQITDLEVFVNCNKGVNRRFYTRLMTSRAMYHFVVIPFILVNAYYVSELNDFVNYHCSSLLKTEKNNARNSNDVKSPYKIFPYKNKIPVQIGAYGCDCETEEDKLRLLNLSKDKAEIIQQINLGFLKRPAMFEIPKFTFETLQNKHYFNSQSILEGGFNNIFLLLLMFSALTILAYRQLNYYVNQFFFYELMEACHEGYYPTTKNSFANNHVFNQMIYDDDIKNLIQTFFGKEIKSSLIHKAYAKYNNHKIDIKDVFKQDHSYEISPLLRMDFMLKYNQKQFAEYYKKIWKALPNDECRYILYDFAQDHFMNYKNKHILMELMENGIVNCDRLTGRLKIMNLSFRIFILSQARSNEEFITKFRADSKNGTFGRIKFSILILAVSALALLLYLNKDSYDRVAAIGTGIGSALTLINKLLESSKNQ